MGLYFATPPSPHMCSWLVKNKEGQLRYLPKVRYCGHMSERFVLIVRLVAESFSIHYGDENGMGSCLSEPQMNELRRKGR